ncbi:MAG: polysaccharide biosynthesis C-terminal domain-containing protein, partial [Oscillospiraceae bacterium]|nr:polysaccharide biosynthesis C-terminal domain-containing protein [Oscillospiraceae bacterium]
ILISVILAFQIGLNGIAIGTFCSYCISAVLYSSRIRKLVTGYRTMIKREYVIKVFISALVCVLTVLYIKNLNISSNLLAFLAATALGSGTYMVSLLLTREKTVGVYLNKVL